LKLPVLISHLKVNFELASLIMYFQLCFQSYISSCIFQLEFYTHRKYKIEFFAVLVRNICSGKSWTPKY